MEYIYHLKSKYFEKIKAGKKTIEMRLYDEKRKMLKPNDIIVFVGMKDENKKIKTKVVKLHKFKNFDELYKHFDKVQLGYNPTEPANPADMLSFYPLEEQAKYGVVGIEIKVL